MAEETPSLLIPEGSDQIKLFETFRKHMELSGLKVIEISRTVAGKFYQGPAVNVREVSLVRRATSLTTLTLASPQGHYVIPLLHPITID